MFFFDTNSNRLAIFGSSHPTFLQINGEVSYPKNIDERLMIGVFSAAYTVDMS